jgi:tetratricopeptide (TPR) repeat protein
VSAALATGVGGWVWFRESVPEPPAIQADSIDPAVRAAIEKARGQVRQAPRSATAWGQLGMVLATHSFPTEAHTCLAQAERLDPREPRWPYYQGVLLAPAEPDAAIPLLRRAVELFGDGPDAPRLRLAELLYAQGHLDEAGDQFRRLLQHHPDHARAYLGLGRLAYRQNNLEESLAHLNHSVTNGRTRRASTILRAEIHQRLGSRAAAEQDLRQAAGLPDDPEWPDPFVEEYQRLGVGRKAHLDRANQLLDQRRYAEARTALEQAVRAYPDSDWAWLLSGKAALKQNDPAAAERALRKALKLTPDSVEAWFHLGITLFAKKDLRGAGECFRKATERKPDAQAYYLLGHCLAPQGDEGGAIEAFRKALRYQPNYAQAHLDLGTLLAKRGQNADALLHLGYAVQLDPANLRAKKLLQQVLMRIPIPLGL